ncbi:P-loop containing nucleoside triphosphate hydrolase protein [Aspergillus minisclerotigenes]|uniref:P-loop containing nucleoside triphosphate hydrolase protein n=1 Tax=Aspergillus minisclerotigenes TaxID=656917 RepID=A0A5N6JHG3_9EURO|nr:P-loop containing nucleoside triphosphate hydrolase protein [Aspergillus minisclerotigenes]
MLAPSEQQKRFVIYGVGGSGKTQFCVKFASDNWHGFWGVFWIDASNPKAAEQAFTNIARIGQLDERPESGIYWLAIQEKPWLLIIDNADGTGFDNARYFPPSDKGHILVTSRNPECKVHATIGFEEFQHLEEEEAITLLLRASFLQSGSDTRTRETARPVVQALGCLPLASIQAGASIRQNICSLEEYLDVFRSYKKRILSNTLQGGGSYGHTIFTTFEVSYNRIRSLGTIEATDAIELLHIMVFLHFDQIPETIFQNVWAAYGVPGRPREERQHLKRLPTFLRAFLVILASSQG